MELTCGMDLVLTQASLIGLMAKQYLTNSKEPLNGKVEDNTRYR